MVLDEHEDKHDHRRVGSPTNRFSIGWGVLSIILTVITVSAVAALRRDSLNWPQEDGSKWLRLCGGGVLL
jgi:heme/copper-type cytochrome/quinol oxidase subunit 4